MANAQLDAIRQALIANPILRPDATLEQMRAGMDAMGSMTPSLPGAQCTAVDAGGVPALWVEMAGADSGQVTLYLHGGGYVFGSTTSHRPLLERLARATGGRVLGLDYRLAPEHPFPAPVEDAVKAYRWLLAQGVAAKRIAVSGDSAGGGLTLAMLMKLRDEGVALPACAIPISPWTDMEGTGASMVTRAAVDPMVQKPGLAQIASTYLQGADPKSPLASPLHGDFKGLPPLLVQVGDAETLLDDTTRLEPLLKAAGVAHTLEVWDEMIHVWHLFAPMLDKGQEAIDRIGSFVRSHTA